MKSAPDWLRPLGASSPSTGFLYKKGRFLSVFELRLRIVIS
jgi:hypothetical protein